MQRATRNRRQSSKESSTYASFHLLTQGSASYPCPESCASKCFETATNPEQTDARGHRHVSQTVGACGRLPSRRCKQLRSGTCLPIPASHARLSFRHPPHVMCESSCWGRGSCCAPSIGPLDGTPWRGLEPFLR